jgi:hypothetical protein
MMPQLGDTRFMELRPADVAADIERHVAELVIVAREAGLHRCAFLLEIAVAEAQEVTRMAALTSRPSNK